MKEITSGLACSRAGGLLWAITGLLVGPVAMSTGAAVLGLEGAVRISDQSGAARASQSRPSASFNGPNGQVVWQDTGIDGHGMGIALRSFENDAPTSKKPLTVNAVAAFNQEAPAVAMSPAGGALIVWQGGRRSQQDIFGRILSPRGTWAGEQFFVNVNRAGQQQSPSLATDASGISFVAWESVTTAGRVIQAQRLDGAGKRMGAELTISAPKSAENFSPKVSATGQGEFIVLWTASSRGFHLTQGAARAGQQALVLRRYNSAGLAIGEETVVSEGFHSVVDADLVATPDSIVVAWSERSRLPGGAKAKAARYTLSGQRIGSEVELASGAAIAGEVSAAIKGTDPLFAFTTFSDSGFKTISTQAWNVSSGTLGEVSTMSDSASISRINPELKSSGDGCWLLWSQYSGATAFDIYALRLP